MIECATLVKPNDPFILWVAISMTVGVVNFFAAEGFLPWTNEDRHWTTIASKCYMWVSERLMALLIFWLPSLLMAVAIMYAGYYIAGVTFPEELTDSPLLEKAIILLTILMPLAYFELMRYGWKRKMARAREKYAKTRG